MEHSIPGFEEEYAIYEQYSFYLIQVRLSQNANEISNIRIQHIENEFQNLDVKMRLAFGISQIILNNHFVDDKEGALKECHLLYYKLADLWFAYETFIKFLSAVLNKRIKNIEWIGENTHSRFVSISRVADSSDIVNTRLTNEFGMEPRNIELKNYLQYCAQEARGPQKARLAEILEKLSAKVTLSHVDILTIIYGIRNNFVHNGETTVVPDNFSFENKARLLRIVYPYLCIVLLCSLNQAITEISHR